MEGEGRSGLQFQYMNMLNIGCLLDIQVGYHESSWVYESQVQKAQIWESSVRRYYLFIFILLLLLFFKKVLFRVISLDEIIKGVRVDREEDQQLGSETLES